MGKTENARDANLKAYHDALALKEKIKKDGKRARSTMSTGVEMKTPSGPTKGKRGETAEPPGKGGAGKKSTRPSASVRNYGKRG